MSLLLRELVEPGDTCMRVIVCRGENAAAYRLPIFKEVELPAAT